MFANEVAGVLVVFARGEDELQLVARGESGEVLRAEAQMLAAAGTFDIDNFVDLARHEFERTFAAGFHQQLIVRGEKLAQEGDELAVLQHGLAAGDLDQPAGGRKALDFGEDFCVRHFVSAAEGVLGVAPGAAKIASGETTKTQGSPAKELSPCNDL